ncbi:MAG: hypothetical protein CVV47_10770 [Spirochaetae bacterium HGW-Spirochaetae-3]|nr:MAG: hypothetical protein CVV47_10770 [Spirochaetae bacterium HGW-Spirochaetae-3]
MPGRRVGGEPTETGAAGAAFLDALILAAGGAANIERAVSCVTRLRLSLFDPTLADEDALGHISGCAGVIRRGRERHLVFGVAAARICGKLNARLAAKASPGD